MPISPPNPHDFLSFHPKEVAQQLCIIDQTVFRSITPEECLNQKWNTQKDEAKHIVTMITRFNKFSDFIICKILSYDTLKERVRCLKHILKILVVLRQLNNFNSCQAIMAGLTSAPIFRLKITWDVCCGKYIYRSG